MYVLGAGVERRQRWRVVAFFQSHGARYACLEIWAWSGVQSSAEWCQVTSLGTIIGLFCLVPSDVTWHHSAKEFSKLSCALHITLRFPDKHTLLHDFAYWRHQRIELSVSQQQKSTQSLMSLTYPYLFLPDSWWVIWLELSYSTWLDSQQGTSTWPPFKLLVIFTAYKLKCHMKLNQRTYQQSAKVESKSLFKLWFMKFKEKQKCEFFIKQKISIKILLRCRPWEICRSTFQRDFIASSSPSSSSTMDRSMSISGSIQKRKCFLESFIPLSDWFPLLSWDFIYEMNIFMIGPSLILPFSDIIPTFTFSHVSLSLSLSHSSLSLSLSHSLCFRLPFSFTSYQRIVLKRKCWNLNVQRIFTWF